MKVFLIGLLIFGGASAQKILHLSLNQTCRNETEPWVCKKSSTCKGLKNVIQNGKMEICTFVGGKDVVICCPPDQSVSDKTSSVSETNSVITAITTSSEFPEGVGKKAEEKCREYAKYVYRVIDSPVLFLSSTKTNNSECAVAAETLIVGGYPARLNEFPHMALIGYKKGTNVDWFCGGSLISPRFILSAAHCRVSKSIDKAVVRLGDLIINSNKDRAKPIDVRIVEVFDHPNYHHPINYHDISLLKMEHDVTLGPSIRPLCLQTKRSINSKKAIASGWGHTTSGGNPSDSLQKVNFTISSDESCKNVYQLELKKLPKGILSDIMFCAGEKGKDTCQGDSGGPLQIPVKDPYCMYSLIGITSFGANCGTAAPGGYTRVSYYVPWIESIVWP